MEESGNVVILTYTTPDSERRGYAADLAIEPDRAKFVVYFVLDMDVAAEKSDPDGFHRKQTCASVFGIGNRLFPILFLG